ncbi:hypothetical protein LPB03_10215 [Polaribacter vadi]|uniref:CBM-cenC domain-containing protein n=1 Tax=Polaribacter vadi TaxID=1774273 RepID=A0A1B8TS75_9FLAO|nr:hypothetical protein [Polaribacter vadi]AOW17805.1 hypothetical protein LPB03_10215 [Polaribacter vadi]OBY62531.1 hypothetical protein LPB3_10225 [Polaribacter vadi]
MNKLLFFFVLSISISSLAQKNLIKNGGFETKLDNWRGNSASINPYEKKSGENSCIITQYVGKEWKGIDQIANIPENSYALEISIWTKSDAIKGGKEKYNAGVAIAEFVNNIDAKVSSTNIAEVTGTTTWTLNKQLIIVPKEASKLRIMLALAQTNGVIIFDDLNVVGVTKEDYLKKKEEYLLEKKQEQVEQTTMPKVLLNGDFQNDLSNWNGTGKVISDPENSENFCASISSITNEWVAIDQSADIPEDAKIIEIKGWLKAENIIQGTEPWNSGSFIVQFTEDGTTKTADDQTIGTVTGTTEWKFFRKIFAIPNETRSYRVMLAMSNCTGILLADNIQIKIIK